jgi:hypothetical protein
LTPSGPFLVWTPYLTAFLVLLRQTPWPRARRW